MAGYKEPSFQERTALAQKAREKALKKLAAKPKMDDAEIARRKAAQEGRDAAAAEKRAVRKAEIEQAKADTEQAKAEEQAAAAAAAEAAERPQPTEAELKAARDAKYAARKARNK